MVVPISLLCRLSNFAGRLYYLANQPVQSFLEYMCIVAGIIRLLPNPTEMDLENLDAKKTALKAYLYPHLEEGVSNVDKVR